MPCSCSGFRAEKCNCKILSAGYPCDDSGLALYAHNKSVCQYREPKVRSYSSSNIIYNIIELLYEKCAAYNLRYCPIGGFTKHDSHFCNTLKDFLILVCFLLANFVVFLTISFKTVVHLYYVIMASAQWLAKSFPLKADTNNSTVALRTSMITQNYMRAFPHKYH